MSSSSFINFNKKLIDDINYRFPSYKNRNEYYDLKSYYDPVSGYGPICNNIDNADCFGYYSKPKKYFYIGDFFLNKFYV